MPRFAKLIQRPIQVAFMIVSLLIMAGCSQKENSNREPEHQKQNMAIAQMVFDNFNKHDWESMAKLYVETTDFKDPSLGKNVVKQTRQQTVSKYKELEKMSPDIHDAVKGIYPSGDKYVTAEFISTGTTPDGKKWELPICTIFTIENGLITSDCTYYDRMM